MVTLGQPVLVNTRGLTGVLGRQRTRQSPSRRTVDLLAGGQLVLICVRDSGQSLWSVLNPLPTNDLLGG